MRSPASISAIKPPHPVVWRVPYEARRILRDDAGCRHSAAHRSPRWAGIRGVQDVGRAVCCPGRLLCDRRPSGFWATTLTDVYAREAAGEARNMGLLAGGWTCSRCLGCLVILRAEVDDCGQTELHCVMESFSLSIYGWYMIHNNTEAEDGAQLCGPHGQDSMPGCWIRSRQAPDASMACRPVQTGCHRQDRISRSDVARQVQARITSNETLTGTTPCLAAALSRAASSMSWRRHGPKAPDYRLTGSRSGEGKRQDGSLAVGRRAESSTVPGGPGLDRADESRLDRCRDAGCRPSGIGLVHSQGLPPTRSVGRN